MDLTKPPFLFKRRVAYYETDAMGVVHHSNYIRYFEDARVDWMRHSGLINHHLPTGDFVFAVVDVTCTFKRPLKFNDEFKVSVWAELHGARVRLSYQIHCEGAFVAEGSTDLAPLDAQFRPARLPLAARALF